MATGALIMPGNRPSQMTDKEIGDAIQRGRDRRKTNENVPGSNRPSEMSKEQLKSRVQNRNGSPDAETSPKKEPNKATWRERLTGAARTVSDKVKSHQRTREEQRH